MATESFLVRQLNNLRPIYQKSSHWSKIQKRSECDLGVKVHWPSLIILWKQEWDKFKEFHGGIHDHNLVFDLELQELVGDLLTDEDKAAVEKNLRLAFATHKTKNSENPVFVKEKVRAGWNIQYIIYCISYYI